MIKRIKKNDNFLDLVPLMKQSQDWETKEDGLIQVIIPRNSILDKIVRIFFKTPEVIRIDLDLLGSSVWRAIDGKRNVKEIAQILKNRFGEDVEPLYERLGTYINILRNNKFITLKKVRY